jgi:hypothetical protein
MADNDELNVSTDDKNKAQFITITLSSVPLQYELK